MKSHQELGLSLESAMEILKKIHRRIYFLTFGILGISLLISQAFLHIFNNSSLFFSSSFWVLIAGLPVLGFQLKKARKVDQQITETLLQGLNLEIAEKSGGYFTENVNFYQKQRQFLMRALPMWGLGGLIITWSRVMLKASGSFGPEYFKTMAFVSGCFGFFGIYVFFFSSAPYRKFQTAIKKYSFLD